MKKHFILINWWKCRCCLLNKRGWRRRGWHQLQLRRLIQRRTFQRKPNRLPVGRNEKNYLESSFSNISFSSSRAKFKAFLGHEWKFIDLFFSPPKGDFSFTETLENYESIMKNGFRTSADVVFLDNDRKRGNTGKGNILNKARVADMSLMQSRKLDAKNNSRFPIPYDCKNRI